jgi:DNA-binding CsgD family transcriptional regulator
LAPVRENPGYSAVWPAAAVVVALECRDHAETQAGLKMLAARYLLTPTELQVLQLLADGTNPRAIAELLDVRITTVRSHLRSLFDKTGLRRQVDLVRLIPR